MSIAILTQVYDEMRRLAIAGSVVASGDFRLKKLMPPLEQAGAKAPVFAKVAEAIKAVVESKEQTSAGALLDLTSLVNAILYTQGETGAAGNLEPLETIDIGATVSQASARTLKPLLEALTTTGSGRLELIKDAHERGAIRDLRLVKPALEAIDDVYGEIADLIADKVLPQYGKAILPELKAKFDPKGRAGHPRRLQLMHKLDPTGTRELVKAVLENGSKEVKVVAIECLGADPADLSFLLEQAGAKAQEVRQAAYRALSALDDDAAVAVLQKALTGKDLQLAADSLSRSRNGKLLSYVLAGAREDIAGLAKTKAKTDVSKKIHRIQSLIGCLYHRDDKETEAFLLEMFGQRNDLEKIKGDSVSGKDLNSTVVGLMEFGTPKVQTTLAEAHAPLNAEDLDVSFRAARRALPPARVFEMFSLYLTAKVDEKKKQRDPAWAKREAVIEHISGHGSYWEYGRDERETLYDPRWLDVALKLRHLGLVRAFSKPGHAEANAFLKETFDDVLRKSKNFNDCHEVLSAIVFAAHPQATEAFMAVFEKHGKKADHHLYWFGHLIPHLPATALPRLEALIPSLSENAADSMLGFIQQLREKK